MRIFGQFDLHKIQADLKCEHYNQNIILSKTDNNVTHICYDWAQNVSIPYSLQQIGATYFKIAFAVNIFGICNTEGINNR